MYPASYVAQRIDEMKASEMSLQIVAWETAKLCIGWAYVYGARGEFCEPSNRRSRARSDHPTIQSACKNFNGQDDVVGKCAECKWYPGGRTRFFDCRGLTYWVLLMVYGWKLQGGGATSQWNDSKNWKAKGTIDTLPRDTLVCLFYTDKNNKAVMAHTGLGYMGETIECSNGVQYSQKTGNKWTHWAIPACVEAETVPDPGQSIEPGEAATGGKPTLRQGNSGEYVREMQQKLIDLGYTVGSTGADGKFGRNTKSGLIAFQISCSLEADGICGPLTWAALDQAEGGKLYTVTLQHLSMAAAEELKAKYPGTVVAAEN